MDCAEPQKQQPPPAQPKACLTCAHRLGKLPRWYCGVMGYHVEDERKEYDDDPSCGRDGRWWKQREPEPPTPPSFWTRLGNVILKRMGEQPDLSKPTV